MRLITCLRGGVVPPGMFRDEECDEDRSARVFLDTSMVFRRLVREETFLPVARDDSDAFSTQG